MRIPSAQSRPAPHRESQHHNALLVELAVQRLQLGVLGREAAGRGKVHHQRHLRAARSFVDAEKFCGGWAYALTQGAVGLRGLRVAEGALIVSQGSHGHGALHYRQITMIRRHVACQCQESHVKSRMRDQHAKGWRAAPKVTHGAMLPPHRWPVLQCCTDECMAGAGGTHLALVLVELHIAAVNVLREGVDGNDEHVWTSGACPIAVTRTHRGTAQRP